MRAIIRLRTNVEDERIDDILKQTGWLPRINNDEVIQRRRKEILETINEDDIEVVKETLLPYLLLDDPTKTWGILNRPTENLLTFRLKNPIPDRLKTATEKLVRDLQSISESERNISFEFVSKIEVLEPGGYMHAFSGSVLPKNRFKLAVQRRQTEWYVGSVAFVAAVILILLTIPPLQETVPFLSSKDVWGEWNLGSLQRLSTSAIVTATVSWLNVFLYWFDLRRKEVIVWEA